MQKQHVKHIDIEDFVFAEEMPGDSLNIQLPKDIPTVQHRRKMISSCQQFKAKSPTALVVCLMLLLQTFIHPFLIGRYFLFSREAFI